MKKQFFVKFKEILLTYNITEREYLEMYKLYGNSKLYMELHFFLYITYNVLVRLKLLAMPSYSKIQFGMKVQFRNYRNTKL